MSVRLLKDPVLTRFRLAVDEVYGPRVERVIRYGSRARGKARADSDYDIAVFLRDLSDRAQEMDRLADIGTEILHDIGGLVHSLPYGAGSYRDRTPLRHEIREVASIYEAGVGRVSSEVRGVSGQGAKCA